MNAFTPGYLQLKQTGILKQRAGQAAAILKNCTLCPRKCSVDRTRGETGICSTGEDAVIASFAPHFGEEPPLVGTNGSGTIFFSHCNLNCCFCQNFEISCKGEGLAASTGQVASIMLELKKKGCHNINLVTPSHVVPQILLALDIAAGHGLDLPLVYNTSGYDSVKTLELLDGIVDIYMPDIKFFNSKIAASACRAPDYPMVVKQAVKQMHHQVGDLHINDKGIAVRGLLVRHLVLPESLAGTDSVMKFISQEISSHTHVNVMSQYRPMGEATKIKQLSRQVTPDEYKEALKIARSYGLNIIS